MLTIVIEGATEVYDEEKNEFSFAEEDITVTLEHSLVSLSKWESIFKKPFIDGEDRTNEETLSYIQCMVVGAEIPPEAFARINQKNIDDIAEYINHPMSATWFRENPNAPRSREKITAELIYYWMISFDIPKECETWHLNRLFTLIKIFNAKNTQQKPMSREQIHAQNRELNAQRRAQANSTG